MESPLIVTMENIERQVSERVAHARLNLAVAERELEAIRAAIRHLNEGAQMVDQPICAMADSREKLAGGKEARKQTMKQLTLIALRDHFPNGATAADLLTFLGDHWGRVDIMRSSYSPQLSRLKDEGWIKRDGNMWRLDNNRDIKTAPTNDGGTV